MTASVRTRASLPRSHDALGGISHKVLTDTLRRAERDGLVMRHVDAERVEGATLYRRSDLGRSLDKPLTALDRWTASHWDQVEAPGNTGPGAVNKAKEIASPSGTGRYREVSPEFRCR
jgi:hypothetical protein